MSAPDHSNNGPRANDAVANRGDGGQGAADASRQGPAAAAAAAFAGGGAAAGGADPADPRDDETANEFGSSYAGGFGYGHGYGYGDSHGDSQNRNPGDGTRKYVPALRDDPNKQDEKSRAYPRCQPPPEYPPGGPSDRDGDSSNRT